MNMPDKYFTYEGETYELDAPAMRVGKAKVEQRYQELKNAYETGFSELSNFSGSPFGEIGLAKTVIFKTDSAVEAIRFSMESSDLILIPESTNLSGYGSVSVVTFHKNDQMIADDLAVLKQAAEEQVEAFVKAFNQQKAIAISEAVNGFKLYQDHQEDQLLREQQDKLDQENYFRNLTS